MLLDHLDQFCFGGISGPHEERPQVLRRRDTVDTQQVTDFTERDLINHMLVPLIGLSPQCEACHVASTVSLYDGVAQFTQRVDGTRRLHLDYGVHSVY